MIFVSSLKKAYQQNKIFKAIIILLVILIIGLFIFLEILSRGAAMVFNQAMENQDMLRGSVKVEKLLAHINGYVSFENLVWEDNNGNTILKVPSGSFKVSIIDVMTNNLKSTTIQELTLNDAVVSIHLADDMQVDFIKPTPAMRHLENNKDAEDNDWRNLVSLAGKSETERKAIGKWRREYKARKLQKNWANFNRNGRKIKMKLNFNNCFMEVFFKERHYLLEHVAIHTDVDTSRQMSIDANTGGFGGTMIGDGVRLKGAVDFTTQPMPICDLRLRFIEVDPSSLGFGLNIHDKMTMDSHFTGPIDNISGEGSLYMRELHIPGLYFKNVTGDINYQGAKMTFSKVTADVYGGHLVAEGVYDLDTRSYSLHGKGTELDTAIALPKSHLSCKVDLDLNITSEGSANTTIINGSFISGAGHYRILPFKHLQGSFSNKYHDLQLFDVKIACAGFNVATDAFRIKDGKLTMEPINLSDIAGRKLITIPARK